MLERIGQSKQQLCESEERFNLAIDGATDGLWTGISHQRCLLLSALKEMLVMPTTKLPNQFDECGRVIPDDVDRVNEALNNHLNGQTAFYESSIACCTKMVSIAGSGSWRIGSRQRR